MEHSPPPFFVRGPAPLVRLAFFASLSLTLLVLDARFRYAEGLRSVLALAAYPLQQAARMPVARKLDGMRDKIALREVAGRVLPPEIAERPKQPYRAPEVAPFVGDDRPDWIAAALEPAALRATGFFDPDRVAQLVRRCRSGRVTGMREAMALVGIMTTQALHSSLYSRPAGSWPDEATDPLQHGGVFQLGRTPGHAWRHRKSVRAGGRVEADQRRAECVRMSGVPSWARTEPSA